jgi:N-hydroxyarylamine O-acetyltransferase
MPSLHLDAYLARIGYRGELQPSRALLTSLHEAHVAAVPFENLDILLGRPIRLDVPSLQAKLVAGGRGGYCFEHNTLFQAALEALGFPVTPLAARVRSGGGAVRPRTHMLLRVDLPEGPHLADVGFGGEGPTRPVPLAAGAEVEVAGDRHRLRQEDGLWVLEGLAGDAWADLYAFTLERQHPVDYEMANHFTSTWPSSPFVQSLTAQRSWPGRRAVLRNRELVVREGAQRRTETVRDPDHLLAVLDEVFGLAFPAGTRFTRPEFAT